MSADDGVVAAAALPSPPIPESIRKIVHVDMDAFYASVEQRDDPALRGRPVVVAWRGERSVVCAASYEARRHGVRSAMPARRAERLCPQAVFVAPDFNRYRTVSRQVRQIMIRYTNLIEPLSLDEAYLDVTDPGSAVGLGLGSATAIAQAIRSAIREELALTASAGVAANKFLAKIASDWRKPDGLFVIRPSQVQTFLSPLPVGRLPGVGQVGQRRLAELGVATVAQLRQLPAATLAHHFGRWGLRLAELARGIDPRPVQPDRPTQSISSEDTFAQDLTLAELRPQLQPLAEKTWRAASRERRVSHTVVLKLRTGDFRTLTRSLTPDAPPDSLADLLAIVETLCQRVELPAGTRYRLAGVGLANFREPEPQPPQAELFPDG